MPTYPNKYYYLGPWVIKKEISEYYDDILKENIEEIFEYYDAPDHTVGRIDMRPVSDITEAYGFFSTNKPLSGADYINLGDDLYSDLTGLQLDAWKSALNMQAVDGLKLIDVLWDTLTANADPEGWLRTYPIMPTHLGIQELHLGGHSLIKTHRFKGEQDPSWPVVQKLLRENYRQLDTDLKEDKLKDRKLPDDLTAKVLGAWKLKFKVSNEGLFIPDNLPKIKSKKPTTPVSDDFDRVDGAIGASWNVLVGSFNVVSNEVLGGGVGRNIAYYDTVLSSSDNYGQSDIRDNTSEQNGRPDTSATCRNSNTSGGNYYEANYNTESDAIDGYFLRKNVSGTITALDFGASGSGTKTIRCSADGSIIKMLVDTVEELSITDTSISTGLYAGIFDFEGRGYHNNFIGGDLVQGGLLPINFITDDVICSMSGKVGVGGSVATTLEGTILNQISQEGKSGTLSSDTENILLILLGNIGVSGFLSSIISNSILNFIGKPGVQGQITTQVSLSSLIFGEVEGGPPPDVIEGTISSIMENSSSSITGQLGVSGNIISQVIISASLAGQLGSSGSYTMQLDNVSSIIEGVLGVSGQITTTISAGLNLVGKLGISGNIVASLEDLSLQLIEIVTSDRIYQIVISTKTGQVMFLAPKTGQINIKTKTGQIKVETNT
ncbi:MAG: hypothetical protein V3W20_10700 [Candidatus Neomarinimicrobiota bacterium]